MAARRAGFCFSDIGDGGQTPVTRHKTPVLIERRFEMEPFSECNACFGALLEVLAMLVIFHLFFLMPFAALTF